MILTIKTPLTTQAMFAMKQTLSLYDDESLGIDDFSKMISYEDIGRLACYLFADIDDDSTHGIIAKDGIIKEMREQIKKETASIIRRMSDDEFDMFQSNLDSIPAEIYRACHNKDYQARRDAFEKEHEFELESLESEDITIGKEGDECSEN